MSASPAAIVRGAIRSTPLGWSKVRLNPEALLAAGDSRQPSLSVCLDRAAPRRFSLSEFKEELVWRNKERVLLEHPSDITTGEPATCPSPSWH